MNDKQDRMIKITKDTKKFYEADPEFLRAVADNGNCMYTLWDADNGETRHCAIGRYLKEEYQNDEWNYNNDTGVHGINDLDSYLKEDVRGLDDEFWSTLQDFHDMTENWVIFGDHNVEDKSNKYGITDRGHKAFHLLISQIERGLYGKDEETMGMASE